MKILIRKSDKRVIYAGDDLELDNAARGNNWIDPNFNKDNAVLEIAILPDNWSALVWTYADGTWEIVDQYWHDLFISEKIRTNEAARIASIPISVSPRQIRQALSRVELRELVEAAIAASDQDTKDWWNWATVFERQHPKVIQMGLVLNQSTLQMDDIFILAGSL